MRDTKPHLKHVKDPLVSLGVHGISCETISCKISFSQRYDSLTSSYYGTKICLLFGMPLDSDIIMSRECQNKTQRDLQRLRLPNYQALYYDKNIYCSRLFQDINLQL